MTKCKFNRRLATKIIDKLDYVGIGLTRRACGAWIPLFTNDLEITKERKLWLLSLVLAINNWDRVKGKKCDVTTISKDNELYGVKMGFLKTETFDNNI